MSVGRIQTDYRFEERTQMRQMFVVSVLLGCFALGGCNGFQSESRTPPPIVLTAVSTAISMPTNTSAIIATPARTLTELETIDAEMRAYFGSVHPNCSSSIPVPEGANCSQYLWTKPITKTEWAELFPNAHFYLLGFHEIVNLETSQSGYRRNYRVIVQQGGQRYTDQSFSGLLEANGITFIGNEQQELVARAFALMTVPNYLEDEIVFTNWEKGSWSSVIRLDYNYALTAWTKIQGLKVQWRFIFYEGHLIGASSFVQERGRGDYIDVPFGELPEPSPDSTTYWRR